MRSRRQERHAGTEAIDGLNRRSLRRIATFRRDFSVGRATFAEFSHLKHKHPFIGFVPCRAQGLEFVIFSVNDDVVGWEYHWMGDDAYEPEIVATWVDWCRDEGGLIYDIGAYTGLMSILAALANPRNRLVAFEPIPRTVERIKINLRANMLANRVVVYSKAASDSNRPTWINLYRDKEFLGTGSSLEAKVGKDIVDKQRVECVAIDDLIPDGEPVLAKIDVEGHELAALQGLERTIRRSKPRMIVEVWQHTRAEVLMQLASWGYSCTAFEAKELPVMNFRCVPLPG